LTLTRLGEIIIITGSNMAGKSTFLRTVGLNLALAYAGGPVNGGVGNSMVIFLAGLQGIPTTLYDAAEIDGANWWQRFWAVTIPLLSPVILFNLVLGVIGSFQIFTGAYLLTNGGPAHSTLFSVLYLYRLGFEQFRMGYASAVAWLLFLVILLFTIAQFYLSKSRVHYEGEVT
jgi:multiple sugar transport system permease protein